MLNEFKLQIEDAVLLFPTMSPEDKAKAMQFWNVISENLQVPNTYQLQNTLMDPAVNIMFAKMQKEVTDARAKVEEMQNELTAWKFTPNR